MASSTSDKLREILSQKEVALVLGVGIGVAATLLVVNRDKVREQVNQAIARINKDGKAN